MIKLINNFKIDWIRENWSLIGVLSILYLTITILYFIITQINQNHLIYFLDDPYIHMAVAKNFSLYEVWGVTKYSFSSSTSSILWVLILSATYKIFGVNEVIPFLLNIIFASVTLSLVYFIFKKFKFPQWYSFIILLLILFLTPIPALIFLGMEHTLQILLVLVFIYFTVNILTTQENLNKRNYYYLIILGVLLVTLRYESLFLISIVSLLLFLKKRYIWGLILILFSIIPILIYGIISMSNGWLFLPNSLVTRSFLIYFNTISLENIFMMIKFIMLNFYNHIYLVFLLILSLVFFIKYNENKPKYWSCKSILLIIFILLTFTNLFSLAVPYDNSNLLLYSFKYDSYLVTLGLLVIAILLKRYLPDKSFRLKKEELPKYLAVGLIILLILSPFSLRVYSIANIAQASNNIYEQQYQMGLFLNEYYNGESVAINDIGAISFLSNAKTLDLWSLGSITTLKYHEDLQIYNPQVLDSLIKENNVKVIVVYDQNFKSKPDGLIKVAEWTIPRNIVCTYDTVSFYSTSPYEARKLVNNLKEFSPRLPADIKQVYF